MKLHKILKIVAAILGVLGIVYALMITSTGEDTSEAVISQYITIAYVTMIVITLLVLVFVFKGLAGGDIKKTLISVGAFVGVILIAYLMSSGDEIPLKDGGVLSASGSKWVGTGLHAFYLLTFIAIGAMVFTGVKKILKR